ncbi:MAG: hypothetical protein NVS4B10_06100 [Myxococcales bacterium]
MRDERGAACGSGRSGAILELAIPTAALGLAAGDSLGLSLRVLRDDVEIDRLPRYGELSLALPGPGFEQVHWRV